MKKIIFFAALALSLLFVSAVYAAEGSLTIVGGPYEGKYYKTDFSIYKIAGSDFTLTENFAGLGLDLSAIDTAEETEAAADVVSSYINENNIAYMYEKSGESQVTFSNLEEGYYFLEFNKTENADMMSFIIGIPYYDSDSGEYYYDVSITAKITAGSTGGGGGTGSD
ncbi:MAG: hypothetical protein LUD77_05195 [Clostridiales bacterium]|nr:hypothetical protein [Clostridiales bacterium]